MNTGRCECGQVRFEIKDLTEKAVTYCHCSQCRRISGHQWAAFHIPTDQMTFVTEKGLKWYKSSAHAQRGFCQNCGSSLFYRLNAGNNISIAPGCMDDTKGLKPEKHIFVADKGDYYEITDGLDQIDKY